MENLKKIYRSLRTEYRFIKGYFNRHFIRKNHSDKEKKRILIILNFPQGWNTYKPILNAFSEYNCDVDLIAWTGTDYPNNVADFWKAEIPEINISSPNRIISLDQFAPDIVFRQTPYEDEYPREYSANTISKSAKLCYIPYGYEPSREKHLRIEYNYVFFPYVDAIFADNSSTYNYCIDKKKESIFLADIQVYDLGFPRFDLIKIEERQRSFKSFLWIPRWSVNSKDNDGTSFFSYFKFLVDFFAENKGCSLIIRPHPLMFSNFIKEGVLSKDNIDELKNSINRMQNVSLDENSDYLESFSRADVLIADFSSIMIEFFISGKPIIYTGGTLDYNDASKKIIDYMEVVNDWSELKKRIEMKVEGIDPKYQERISFIEQFRGGTGSIAKRIVEVSAKEL